MSVVELASIPLRYGSDDPALSWQLEWHFSRLPTSAGPPDLEVRLGSHPDTRPEPRGEMLRDGPMIRWDDGERLILHHDDGMRAAVTDQTLWLDASTATQDWRPTRQLLFSGLSWNLARRGLVMLHGALVAREGTALAVLGDTGAGKSTIAVSALVDGWELLADDLFVVRVTPVGMEAFGVPKRVMVASELIALLGTELPELTGDLRGRHLLPLDELTVGWRPLAGLALASHDPSGGSVTPVDRTVVMEQLMGGFLEARHPAALRRHLAVLAALLGLPAHGLALPADRDERAARTADLLSRVWMSSVGGQDPEPLRRADGTRERSE